MFSLFFFIFTPIKKRVFSGSSYQFTFVSIVFFLIVTTPLDIFNKITKYKVEKQLQHKSKKKEEKR